MSSVEFLRQIPFCAGLSDAQLAVLAGCLGKRALAKGVFVFHKDSPGRALFIVETGRVRIFTVSDSGMEMSLNSYGPGDVFGEVAVLDGLPRSAAAIASEPSVILSLRQDDLLQLLNIYPQLARNLIDILTTRLRRTTRFAEDLAFLDVQGRVAARLLDLDDRFGASGRGTPVALNLTQGELACWVAASRESVNKVLVGLRTRGLIDVQGHQITILDWRQLEREVRY